MQLCLLPSHCGFRSRLIRAHDLRHNARCRRCEVQCREEVGACNRRSLLQLHRPIQRSKVIHRLLHDDTAVYVHGSAHHEAQAAAHLPASVMFAAVFLGPYACGEVSGQAVTA